MKIGDLRTKASNDTHQERFSGQRITHAWLVEQYERQATFTYIQAVEALLALGIGNRQVAGYALLHELWMYGKYPITGQRWIALFDEVDGVIFPSKPIKEGRFKERARAWFKANLNRTHLTQALARQLLADQGIVLSLPTIRKMQHAALPERFQDCGYTPLEYIHQ